MIFSYTITGIREIDENLNKLNGKDQRKIITAAMRKSMKDNVLPVAKNTVPVDTGLYRDNLMISSFKARRKNHYYGVSVKVRRNEGFVKHNKAGKRQWYPAVVEFGISGGPYARPAGKHLRNTYKLTANKAQHDACENIKAGVIKLLTKDAKKAEAANKKAAKAQAKADREVIKAMKQLDKK